MPKTLQAHIVHTDLGRVTYELTPKSDGSGGVMRVDLSGLRPDAQTDDVRNKLLSPFGGLTEFELNADDAKKVLRDVLGWSEMAGTRISLPDKDIFFIHADVLAALANLNKEEQEKGEEAQAQEQKTESEQAGGEAEVDVEET